MEQYREQLSRPRLSAISAVPDRELDTIAQIIGRSLRIRDRGDLEEVLGQLLAAADTGAAIAAKTLDLIGHSTPASLLRLGDLVVDAANPRVMAFFRGLADCEVLPRLGIRALRLLGCDTAGTAQGRSTLCTLEDILGVEVLGTQGVLCDHHYDGDGFCDLWSFMLVSSRDLHTQASPLAATPGTERWPRTLDIDALPALPLSPQRTPWPQRIATGTAVRRILALICRNAGARMPGLIATPSCELAVPSATRSGYHLMHILFDGAFVRCFPDGASVPGVVYPVDDAPLLHRIVGELPLLELSR
jgi:hypothetical protein